MLPLDWCGFGCPRHASLFSTRNSVPTMCPVPNVFFSKLSLIWVAWTWQTFVCPAVSWKFPLHEPRIPNPVFVQTVTDMVEGALGMPARADHSHPQHAQNHPHSDPHRSHLSDRVAFLIFFFVFSTLGLRIITFSPSTVKCHLSAEWVKLFMFLLFSHLLKKKITLQKEKSNFT